MQPSRILRAAHGEKPNITGFDMAKLRKATGTPRYDPWERAEAWRYTGRFTRANRFKNSLPGLGTAIVAFTAYCAYEHFFMKEEHHGEAHH
ncbi:hypothetical protein BT67DRAFT_448936 [Trichocladium antarcticum]|uniref:NADH-ubiquinone oxidoreductase B12 subunit n=1 Tax=Trichocladium antarcticum TaxID=1450529 RepID=A0AAN6UMK1_9PEZI|nr:hypothetical protein BT67DRAFT_448936 [Trichocladium antarcticum]